MRRTLLSTFAAGALLLLLGGSAAGQSGGEVIHSYVVEIRILDDGDLAVTETIDYDFGSELRHGIFRTIPTRFPYDDVNDRVYPIEDVSVESPHRSGRCRGLRGGRRPRRSGSAIPTWRSRVGTRTPSPTGWRVR